MSGASRAVVGAGSWGTTLALLLARSGPVTLVARDHAVASTLAESRENAGYLPGVRLPVEIEIVAEPEALSDAHELVIMAVPSAAMRGVCAAAAPFVPLDAVIMSVAKGIERGSLRRMTQVITDEIPGASGRVAAMSGPNLALEIARGLPASSVIGAEDEAVSDRVITILASRSFRLYRNRDVIGVELCGALKNISPSRREPPIGWDSATTARRGSSRAGCPR